MKDRQKTKDQLIRELAEMRQRVADLQAAEAERQRAEELGKVAARRAAELQAIVDHMVEGVFVCDADGRISLVNKAGLRLLGLRGAEELRRPLTEIVAMARMRHPDGTPMAPDELPLARALRGETLVDEGKILENQTTRRDVLVLSSAGPIRDEEGRIVGAVTVVRDVTELTELERLKGQFISVAAHELKTPVTIMKGYAQTLLRTDAELSPQRRRMLEAIDRGADRISRIIDDLLDVSRLHVGRLELSMETVDLTGLVRQVVDRMQHVTKRHRVRVVSAEPAVVRGDRERLEQALGNLIDNAIRYSPEGGDVDVAVAIRDGEAVVSVRDHGVGIPKDRQARIFERFYRAHTGTPHDYGGIGIGLHLTKEIIVRHGGRIWFESEEGKGSTFYFSLPLKVLATA